ncbi:peroxiredoxin [Leucobacter sp. cx-42]|uniref:peroxiredoxin n=1 Tax=unclassified Leucobacter TaxID=2621730 RepID=UPI00165E7852|nr:MULTISPECIES: peroxiredoxin [unclassified Leucobacter]MBC9954848.1 peroxiredoxin [Leucobacter sp. cx-42]
MVLEVGTIAPDFTLSDQNGEELTLSELVTESPVALVFFPLAFSGICTGELCELRDNIAIFEDAKVRVLGVSVDSVYTLKAWADQEGYNFSVLSDFWPHGAVSNDYGVFIDEAGIATRATFLIGEDRKILASFATEPGQARDFAAYRDAVAKLA